MSKETWRNIPGFGGRYKGSSHGRIRSIFTKSKLGKIRLTGTILKFTVNHKGYYTVKLIRKTYKVHRLICRTFHENPTNKPEVNHKDLDKLNNRADNLEWCTAQENMDHYYASGKVVRSRVQYKIPDTEVSFIRQNYMLLGKVTLAKKYSVDVQTIDSIARGRRRNTATDTPPCTTRIGKPVLDTRDGTIYPSARELAKTLGISAKQIHRRLNGERINNTPYKYAHE